MNRMPTTVVRILLLVLCSGIISGFSSTMTRPHFRLAIHGGAGTILKSNMTPEKEKAYREKLTEALQAGYSVLKGGGTSLDAVQSAINIMEDSPLFNAGKGAVFTHEGTNEMDASIMDGATLKAGAVAAVKHVKNPIDLARLVMDRSAHVMLVGDGAETFAKEQGMQLVDEQYFFTERRWKDLQNEIQREQETKEQKHGTVGAVALDADGNLAAATSTGGITNKRFGRVGDSPIIGAGTYANNNTCAVSSTGHGEDFIRSCAAYDISALMEYKGMSVSDAAETVVMDKLVKIHGDGGVIAMDHDGNIAMPFNTPGMYRGHIDEDGSITIEFYKE